MAERGKEERTEQCAKLDAIIKKHEELISPINDHNHHQAPILVEHPKEPENTDSTER